jgi:hypothetical protein
MSIFSTNVKASGHIYVHAPNLAAAILKVRQLETSVFHVTDINSSYFKNGDPSAPEISLGDRIWAEAPTVRDQLKIVSSSVMIDRMHLSADAPPKTFQYSAPSYNATRMVLYCAVIELRCSAFVRARSYCDALERAAGINGPVRIDKHSGWFEDWFWCESIYSREMPFVLSPVMEIVGISAGHKLKQLWPKPAGDEKKQNVPADLRVVGARLKNSLAVFGGNFASMSAEDAVDIARYAKILLDR